MKMNPVRIAGLAATSMLAFAANSLLCRLALRNTPIDAASFTTIRLLAGALVLLVLVGPKNVADPRHGNWISATALFVYAAAFSFAYGQLMAGVGALILFGAVQTTMLVYGVMSGERLGGWQVVGISAAAGGLLWLFLPGVSAPPLGGALMMATAGFSWGVYSLRGRMATDAKVATAGNFVRAAVFAVILSAVLFSRRSWQNEGALFAVLSGAITSGLGYIIWYSVLPQLAATVAAILQLSVPIITAIGGVLVLGEPLTARLMACTAAILGGIALVNTTRK